MTEGTPLESFAALSRMLFEQTGDLISMDEPLAPRLDREGRLQVRTRGCLYTLAGRALRRGRIVPLEPCADAPVVLRFKPVGRNGHEEVGLVRAGRIVKSAVVAPGVGWAPKPEEN